MASEATALLADLEDQITTLAEGLNAARIQVATVRRLLALEAKADAMSKPAQESGRRILGVPARESAAPARPEPEEATDEQC